MAFVGTGGARGGGVEVEGRMLGEQVMALLNPKTETGNLKHETRNPKPETGNPKLET